MHRNNPDPYVYQRTTDVPRPPAFADHSGWVIFSSGDPVTGTTTRHAKLSAASSGSPDGLTIPASSLELIAGRASGNHVFLTLPTRGPCAKLTALDAKFDTNRPVPISVKPGSQAQCVVEVADYEDFVQSLRGSETMSLQIPGEANVTFAVGGLTWD